MAVDREGAGQATRRSQPRRLRRLLFALTPVLVLCCAIESVARFICWQRFAPFETSVRVQGDSRWTPDPATLWANRPFYLEHDHSSQYNEYGMRVPAGQTRLPAKEPGELRIFLLGGSAMAGVGSSQQGDWLKITGISTHPPSDSIDGFLAEMLQQSLGSKKVTVYNAAVASHALLQSQLTYRKLKPLEPDWIVSMDGINDPPELGTSQTTWQSLETRWRRHPVNRIHFRIARGLMRNSAFAFLVGEHLFFRSGIIRTARNSGQQPEIFAKWLGQGNLGSPPASDPSPEQQRAVDAFTSTLRDFHRELTADGVPHLLLVQPHLSLRDPSRLQGTELALSNYQISLGPGPATSFMRALHQRVLHEFMAVPEVLSLAPLHGSEESIFLDYCHLTKAANRYIAGLLAARILRELDPTSAPSSSRSSGEVKN